MHSNHILPIYVVCDESLSMKEHIDELNDNLLNLHHAVGDDPMVARHTLLCLIGFSESAKVLVPLSRPGTITGLFGHATRCQTNFGATFTFVRNLIGRDVAALQARSYRVHRPVVFFLTDGQPTDPATWPLAFDALTDSSWLARPNLIAFGIGDADPVTIGRVGTFRAFMSRDGMSPAAALREVVDALIYPDPSMIGQQLIQPRFPCCVRNRRRRSHDPLVDRNETVRWFGMEDLKERFLASENRLLALVADRGDELIESQARNNRLSRAVRVGHVDIALAEFEALIDLAERSASVSTPKILQTLTWAQNQIGTSLYSPSHSDDGQTVAEPEPANGYQG